MAAGPPRGPGPAAPASPGPAGPETTPRRARRQKGPSPVPGTRSLPRTSRGGDRHGCRAPGMVAAGRAPGQRWRRARPAGPARRHRRRRDLLDLRPPPPGASAERAVTRSGGPPEDLAPRAADRAVATTCWNSAEHHRSPGHQDRRAAEGSPATSAAAKGSAPPTWPCGRHRRWPDLLDPETAVGPGPTALPTMAATPPLPSGPGGPAP